MNLLKKFEKRNGDNDLVRQMNQRALEFQDEMRRTFDRFSRTWGIEPWAAFPSPLAMMPIPSMLSAAAASLPWPAIDQTEDEKSITLRVDAPGVDARDLEVTVAENVLTIKGQRQEESEQKEKGYVCQERQFGSFSRSIALPPSTQADQISAKYEKGVLTVTVPKAAAEPAKKVAIATA